MPQVYTFTQQGLQVAHSPSLSTLRAVKLPYGGPTDVGGPYAQGLLLTNDPGTAQPEKWTITSTLASGTFNLLFTSGYTISETGSLAYNVSTADLKTALEDGIFGDGSIATVTGTAGTSYVITFADNVRIGGKVSFSQTAAINTISNAHTQRGCCGAGQYDVYNGTTFDTVDAILEYKTYLDATGARVTEYGTASQQPFSPQAYAEGFFFVFKGEDGGDTDNLNLPNIDATAVAAGSKLREALGLYTEAGAIVRLTQ